MKKRSFVLCDLIKGHMQRLDYNVLTPYLQPKYEYVLCLCLSDLQKKLYTYYLDNYARAGQIGEEGQLEGGRRGGLFYDVQILSRIWNHPYILMKAKQRADLKKLDDDDDELDEAGSLKDFVVDSSDEASTPATTSNDDDDDIQLLAEDDDGAPKASSKSLTRAGRKKLGDGADVLVAGLDGAKRDATTKTRGAYFFFFDHVLFTKSILRRILSLSHAFSSSLITLTTTLSSTLYLKHIISLSDMFFLYHTHTLSHLVFLSRSLKHLFFLTHARMNEKSWVMFLPKKILDVCGWF